MQWGIDMMEQRGWPSVITATPAGWGLYEKCGYTTQEKWFVNMDEHGGKGMYFNAILTRFPKDLSAAEKSHLET